MNKQNRGTSQDTRTLVTVFLLIFVFPVGLIVMWVWTEWKLWLKLLLSFIAVIPIFLIASLLGIIFIGTSSMPDRVRDITRLDDMATLQKAINTSLSKYSNQALCGKEQPPCFYTSDDNSPTVTRTDGSGWFPLKLDSLSQLPKDPLNGKDRYYLYCSDGKDWEINTVFESSQNNSKMENDGGDDPEIYEIGSNLELCQYSN